MKLKLLALLSLVSIQFVSSIASADLVANAPWWVCTYKGKSGSTYYGSDEVREKAFNQAYSQCYSSGDTPCQSAGCSSSNGGFDVMAMEGGAEKYWVCTYQGKNGSYQGSGDSQSGAQLEALQNCRQSDTGCYSTGCTSYGL